jgi:hypothetical protein
MKTLEERIAVLEKDMDAMTEVFKLISDETKQAIDGLFKAGKL